MAFNAADIRAKNFKTVAFHGYSIKEVDDFLDIVTEEMEKLQRANEELENKVKELKRQLSESGGEISHSSGKSLEERLEELERHIL